MGELFDRVLRSDESLFLNPQFLDQDYQPKLVPFREGHQKNIALCINPLLSRRNGKNIIIFGRPGVGKTVSLKHVLNELKEDYGNEVYCLYVNCWKRDTSFKVIGEICTQINYKWIHNKNFDDLMQAAAEIINEKSVVIVLDEVDKLQEDNIIYNILEEFHRRCLILITNDNNFISKLDTRIRSRLIPDLIEFKPYTYSETEMILKQRVEYAFVSNSIHDTAFNLVAKKTYEFGDMRIGLFLLKQAGELAENKSLREISIEHVNQVISSLANINLENDGDQEMIIKIIKENPGKNKGEVFKIYELNGGKSYRTFQRKLKDLEEKKIVSVKEEINNLGKQETLNFSGND